MSNIFAGVAAVVAAVFAALFFSQNTTGSVEMVVDCVSDTVSIVYTQPQGEARVVDVSDVEDMLFSNIDVACAERSFRVSYRDGSEEWFVDADRVVLQ